MISLLFAAAVAGHFAGSSSVCMGSREYCAWARDHLTDPINYPGDCPATGAKYCSAAAQGPQSCADPSWQTPTWHCTYYGRDGKMHSTYQTPKPRGHMHTFWYGFARNGIDTSQTGLFYRKAECESSLPEKFMLGDKMVQLHCLPTSKWIPAR